MCMILLLFLIYIFRLTFGVYMVYDFDKWNPKPYFTSKKQIKLAVIPIVGFWYQTYRLILIIINKLKELSKDMDDRFNKLNK